MRRLLLVLVAMALAVLASPAAASACSVSYQDGTDPNAGCSGTASMVGIAIVGGLAVAIAATVTIANYLRGGMSAKDLESFLAELPTVGTLGETVALVDGTQLDLLDGAGRAAIASYAATLASAGRTRLVTRTGPEYDYQREKLGDTEYDIGGERETWADGLGRERGVAQDAKFRDPGGGRSFYEPSSLPSRLRDFAINDMDRRLTKYAASIADVDNPLRAIEFVTNDISVATFLRARLLALGIPGFIRVEA